MFYENLSISVFPYFPIVHVCHCYISLLQSVLHTDKHTDDDDDDGLSIVLEVVMCWCWTIC